MLQDPLNDAMATIRNAEAAGKAECLIRPASKLIGYVLKVMQENEYIKSSERGEGPPAPPVPVAPAHPTPGRGQAGEDPVRVPPSPGGRARRHVRGPSAEHGRRGDGRLHVRDEDRLQPLPGQGDRQGIRGHHREFPRGEVPPEGEHPGRDEGRGERRPGPLDRIRHRGGLANRREHRAGDAHPRIRPAHLPGRHLHHEESRGGLRMAEDKEPKAEKKPKKTAVPEAPKEEKKVLPTAHAIREAKKAELVAWSEKFDLGSEGKVDELRKRLLAYVAKEEAKAARAEEPAPEPE